MVDVLCEVGTDENGKSSVLFLAESDPPVAFHIELAVLRERPIVPVSQLLATSFFKAGANVSAAQIAIALSGILIK